MRKAKSAVIIIALLILSVVYSVIISASSIQKGKEIEALQGQINDLKIQFETTEEKRVELNDSLYIAKQHIESSRIQIEKLSGENQRLSEETSALKADNSNLVKEKAALQRQLTLKQQEKKKKEVTIASVSYNSSNAKVKSVLTVEATAYTAYCKGCSGKTSTGVNLRANSDIKLIATDPNVIPTGSKVWVEGYGYAIAGDTGGAIKGRKIDVFISDKQSVRNWGRKTVTVKILE